MVWDSNCTMNKHVPDVSNTSYAWGGSLGTEYIIDPKNDLIVLLYMDMFKRDRLYPVFLDRVHDVLEE